MHTQTMITCILEACDVIGQAPEQQASKNALRSPAIYTHTKHAHTDYDHLHPQGL
jgi:hypothetical protein